MFCHKCGNKLVEGSVFCQSCGEKIVTGGASQEAAVQQATVATEIMQTVSLPMEEGKSEAIISKMGANEQNLSKDIFEQLKASESECSKIKSIFMHKKGDTVVQGKVYKYRVKGIEYKVKDVKVSENGFSVDRKLTWLFVGLCLIVPAIYAIAVIILINLMSIGDFLGILLAFLLSLVGGTFSIILTVKSKSEIKIIMPHIEKSLPHLKRLNLDDMFFILSLFLLPVIGVFFYISKLLYLVINILIMLAIPIIVLINFIVF
jgi:hypothetical protein